MQRKGKEQLNSGLDSDILGVAVFFLSEINKEQAGLRGSRSQAESRHEGGHVNNLENSFVCPGCQPPFSKTSSYVK